MNIQIRRGSILKQVPRPHPQTASPPRDENSEPATSIAVPGQGRQRRGVIPIGKRLRQFGLALLYLCPVLILFGIFSYYPFFRAIWLSLNITNEVGDPVKFVGLRYYLTILNLDGSGRDEYVRSLITSGQFAVMVVLLQIVLGVALASLALAKVRGIGIFRVIFTASIAVSLASASVIWAIIYDPSTGAMAWLTDWLNQQQPGVLNNPETALAAIAVVTVWAGLGFNFVITLAGMQAVPEELYESAALDGANGWKRFRYITLPLLSPILLFLLVVNTIQSFQAFTQFNVLINGEGPESTTNVFVYAIFRTFWLDHRYGFASAMSMVLFVILLILSACQLFFLGRRVHYQ